MPARRGVHATTETSVRAGMLTFSRRSGMLPA
jgi:hypothetical protein